MKTLKLFGIFKIGGNLQAALSLAVKLFMRLLHNKSKDFY